MAKTNQNITFKGNKISVLGTPVSEGQKLPSFKLTGTDMSDITNATFAGKSLIVSVVPSLDTPVCATQTKRFNQEIDKLGGSAAVLTVSLDLPMAQKRWCGAEGVSSVVTASDYKYRGFGEDFGCYIQELGLLARAVIVADKTGTIRHVEYVDEVTKEPDYDAALKAAKAV